MTNIVPISNPTTNVMSFVGTPLVFPSALVNRMTFGNPVTNVVYYNVGPFIVKPIGKFKFLKNHVIPIFYPPDKFADAFVNAGDIRDMTNVWQITADVEPLDALGVQSFYDAGPKLGAVIRTQFQTAPITKPKTYWYQVGPFTWKLTGLGAAFAPITLTTSRVEDKDP